MAIDPIMLALMRRGGGGSGAQADYAQNDPQAADYIKNRPGGYTTIDPGYEITWDGEIGDRPVVVNSSRKAVKVSDRIPTEEDLIGSGITITIAGYGDDHITLSKADIRRANGHPVLSISPRDSECALVVGSPVDPFPEAGTYFMKFSDAYVQSLKTKDKEVSVPFEEKYLTAGIKVYDFGWDDVPVNKMIEAMNMVSRGNAIIVWGEDRRIVLGSVMYSNGSDVPVGIQVLEFFSSGYELKSYPNVDGYFKLEEYDSGFSIKDADICNINNLRFKFPLDNDTLPSVSAGYAKTEPVVKLGNRVGFSENNLFLRSSVEDSQKWFKITVDDTGTLKATEVTQGGTT